MTSTPTRAGPAATDAATAAGAGDEAPGIVLTLWTDDPVRAQDADRAGVDRVGVDLERLGKRERQPDPGLWLSTHREESLPLIRERLSRARLFARTNPPHDGWPPEAERLIAAGVEVLMLPAFGSAADVRDALAVVGGRALLVPLVETADALAAADEIAASPGLAEVHFGLNDLALAMGLENRFGVLTQPALESATRTLRGAGVRVGVGGIGRAGDDSLPIPSDLIYAQYPRLGATGALIARSFFDGLGPGPEALAEAIAAARRRMGYWYGCDESGLLAAREELNRCLT